MDILKERAKKEAFEYLKGLGFYLDYADYEAFKNRKKKNQTTEELTPEETEALKEKQINQLRQQELKKVKSKRKREYKKFADELEGRDKEILSALE